MDFERFKEINDTKFNCKELEDASVISLYRNTGCGDGYRVYLKVQNNAKDDNAIITDASYTTTGCGFGVTALAMGTEWVKGKTLKQAQLLTSDDIESLFEFPPMRKNYPETAAEAIQKAVMDYINDTGIKPEEYAKSDDILKQLSESKDLSKKNLRGVILEEKDLQGVDFSGADLRNAVLQKSNLEGAHFKGTKLKGAFLNQTNLENADLREADLRWCKLNGANLDNANVEGALYDIGTKIDQKYIHLFKKMNKTGKELYVTN